MWMLRKPAKVRFKSGRFNSCQCPNDSRLPATRRPPVAAREIVRRRVMGVYALLHSRGLAVNIRAHRSDWPIHMCLKSRFLRGKKFGWRIALLQASSDFGLGVLRCTHSRGGQQSQF